MPRLARLDAPGILHHVMGRGIERKKIFINDTDRNDLIDRLAALAEEGAMDVYAWVLMPTHFTDLWFEKRIKQECNGEALITRYADDFVCAFQYKQDAEFFYQQLNDRLGKFGLEVCPEKTKILPFSRNILKQSETFDFLGFEFWPAISRKFKPIIRRRTSIKKLKASIASFSEWIKTNRNKKISKLMKTLRAKYRGYWNYYGVIGNYGSLKTFYYQTRRILFKWLNRRSQRLSYNSVGFKDLLNQFLIPTPKITEKYPSKHKQLKFFV